MKNRRAWIWGAAIALVLLTALDWTRPPGRQVTGFIYNRVVVGSYRLLVRPMTHRFVRCRFEPTCSQYSQDAVRLHGLPKGLWLSARRIMRCMPWVPMGTHDPVPPRK